MFEGSRDGDELIGEEQRRPPKMGKKRSSAALLTTHPKKGGTVKRRTPAWASAVGVLVLLAPRLAGASEPVNLEKRLTEGDHKGFVAVVHMAYQLLGDYSKSSGSPLSFELSSFRTLYSSELDGVTYGELADVGAGWTVKIARNYRTDHAVGRRTVTFEPKWEDVSDGPIAGYAERPFREVLPDIVADRPDMLADLRAVTTYAVRVELGDRVREYKAAFLWAADRGKGRSWTNLRLLPLDGVTRGLEHALTQPVPPQGRAIRNQANPPFSPTKSVCYAGVLDEHPQTDSQIGHERHSSGYHYGEYASGFRCQCSTSCTSTCSPFGSYTECTDTGSTVQFHVTDLAYDNSTAVRQAATSQGASCASAFICGVKQCSFPSCAFSVTVSVQGSNASFGAPGALWSFRTKFSADCAPCTIDQSGQGGGDGVPPPPENQEWTPIGGGGGGGWNSSGTQVCTVSCYHDMNGNPLGCSTYCW
jgi:hypothetical protein